MKAYKVEIEELDFDRGYRIGWTLVGYYINKEKANRIAKETYENRNKVDTGETRITEIEIDIEED